LAPWNKNRRTEIDFLVIQPRLGILCIEVKSHEKIDFDGKTWTPKTITRNPFKQAEDGSKAFYRSLKRYRPNLPEIPILHCCIFPRAFFDIGDINSVQKWELIDKSVFTRFRTSALFCDALDHIIVKSIDADPDISHLKNPLSKDQVQSIVDACVPIQKRKLDDRKIIEYRKEKIDRLLKEQQKPVLKLSSLNPRLLVRGPAGTGKTLIAMEVARRAADEGKRVALLCFNHLIAGWMRHNLYVSGSPPPNLICGTIHSVFSDMAELLLPESPDAEYWESSWPDLLEEKITDPDWYGSAQFDYLVIDEVQDILSRPRLWQCLDLLMESSGSTNFCLLGDIENQVLSDRNNLDNSLAEILNKYGPAQWLLDENCRNYRITGELALSLSGLPKTTYSDFLRGPGSQDAFDIDLYNGPEDQSAKLVTQIRYFLQKGFKPSEITVLSMKSEKMCIAGSIVKSDFRMEPFWRRSNKAVSYCSIHAYKGMENKVIMLTDISLDEGEFDKNIFYVGLTRGTEFMRLFLDQNSRDLVMQRALGG
jgi:DNA polymerase III delta prime subunit